MSFTFHNAEPKLWTGPYGRIPGESTVFHVRTDSRKGQSWPMAILSRDGDQGFCWAADGPGVRDLVKAVIKGKSFLGGGGGGEFLINEFGQVLVPASAGDGRRAYVGRIEGALRLENPFEPGEVIDLSDDAGLECGDTWPMPYVGCQYNLAAGGWIYTTLETRDGPTFPRLRANGDYLIRSLRGLRPYGATRFIVNPCGIVATKRHDGFEWEAVYVGRLRHGAWFETEGGHPLNLASPVVGT